jgi:hypothetical protein
MKTIFLTLTIMLLTTVTFAQRANNKWSNENVQTISGTIYDNSRPTSYMISDNGTYYKVHLGPIWFWNQNNYSLQTGAIKIKGNVKTINSEYQIYPFTIEQGDNKIILADDNGVPKWGNSKGKGWRNGNGNGWKNGNGIGRGNCWRNN